MFGLSNLKLAMWAALGALLLLIVACGPQACNKYLSARQAERVAKGQAEASINAGAEAMNTVSDLMESDNRTKAIIEQGLEDIRNAPEAEKDEAADRALCQLALYQNTPRCVALRSN